MRNIFLEKSYTKCDVVSHLTFITTFIGFSVGKCLVGFLIDERQTKAVCFDMTSVWDFASKKSLSKPCFKGEQKKF